MLAFANLLVGPAKNAGISVPDEIDDLNIDTFKGTNPHFWVFCMLQLGRRMHQPDEHWVNASIIAGIPLDRLSKMTVAEFSKAGVRGLE